MKFSTKFFSSCALLLSNFLVSAQVSYVDTGYVSSLTVPASTPSSYLFQENFEGTGAENTWTNLGTGYSFDVTSPALEGSQSCGLYSGTTVRLKTVLPSNYDSLWAYCLVRLTNTPAVNGSIGTLIFYAANGSANQCYASFKNDANIRFYHGTAMVDTTSPLTNGTTFHYWQRSTRATSGSNGTAEVYYSLDGIKGSAKLSLTNGSSTNLIGQLGLGASDSVGLVIDKIRLSTTEIGDNPE